jgi:hypothetical protein
MGVGVAGTMSAWAFWAYLGLYPITGTGQYALGSPFFQNITLSLPSPPGTPGAGAALLSIVAHNASITNSYVASATINGKNLPTPYVDHADLVPSLYRPDCEAVKRMGNYESSLCADPDFRGSLSSQPGLLEFFMTDTPTTFSSGK